MHAKLKKAIRLHRAGQLTQARSAYQRILKSEPRNPDAWHFLGVVCHDLGDSESAARHLERALDIFPGYAAAQQNLGNVYRKTGELQKAEACYRRAIELKPALAGGYSNLSIVLRDLQRFAEATEAAKTAVALDPADKLGWLAAGNALSSEHRYEDAIEHYERAISLDRRFSAAHSGLCDSLFQFERSLGLAPEQMNRTRSALKRWLEADPENPISDYLLAALENSKEVKRAPDEFIVATFDSFAATFDSKLTGLGYRVPALTKQKIRQLLKEPAGTLSVLDAGCGTGLLAEELRPWAGTLVGVDLSMAMLAKAEERKLYDKLVASELVLYLADVTEHFDLLICADTLCYFGEIDQVIARMSQAMKKGALLVFSVELLTQGDADFELKPHGRYSHAKAYVMNCVLAAGLKLEAIEHEVLRQEAAQPVDGLLVSAWKPVYDGNIHL